MGGGAEMLVPAYHHGSEIETVRQAGFSPLFYGQGGGLEPRQDELESLITPRTRGLYLIHTLGFPRQAPVWRRWCDERGLVLIEDAAQGWLSASGAVPLGTHADVAIFCLYKVVGLPDGGAVRTSSRLPPVSPPSGGGGGSTVRVLELHRDYLAQRFDNLGRLRRKAKRSHRLREIPERDFPAAAHGTRASRVGSFLRSRFDGPWSVERRRRHFAFLNARLGEWYSDAFGTLLDGCSPLAFPIECDEKPGLVEHLAENGVIDTKLWEVPHPLLEADRFPLARRLRHRLVGLPLHQELTDDDVERIAEVTERWLGRR